MYKPGSGRRALLAQHTHPPNHPDLLTEGGRRRLVLQPRPGHLLSHLSALALRPCQLQAQLRPLFPRLLQLPAQRFCLRRLLLPGVGKLPLRPLQLRAQRRQRRLVLLLRAGQLLLRLPPRQRQRRLLLLPRLVDQSRHVLLRLLAGGREALLCPPALRR